MSERRLLSMNTSLSKARIFDDISLSSPSSPPFAKEPEDATWDDPPDVKEEPLSDTDEEDKLHPTGVKEEPEDSKCDLNDVKMEKAEEVVDVRVKEMVVKEEDNRYGEEKRQGLKRARHENLESDRTRTTSFCSSVGNNSDKR